jgi:serine protease AprX
MLKGVAVDAEVAAFKVLGYGIGAGTNSSVLRGMMDAFEWGADIISMSLGSPYSEDPPEVIPECRAIEMLTKQGIIVVVANGNDGPEPNTVGVPANSPYALSVGAVDINGNVASFSSRGPTAQGLIKPDCCAPGVNILSTSAGLIATMQFMDGPPKLAAISGTSMATPHASGVVALALQYARMKGKTLTTQDIKDALASIPPALPEQAAERAVEVTKIEKNNDTGWGLITYQKLKRYIDTKL